MDNLSVFYIPQLVQDEELHVGHDEPERLSPPLPELQREITRFILELLHFSHVCAPELL